jgi:hypothetical protein
MRNKIILQHEVPFVKNCCTFAPPDPNMNILMLIFGSILKKVLRTNDNTPPMPLSEAHLGGFLFFV